MKEPIKNRYDFVAFFDVKNGNPNVDPDAGGMPRIDPETNLGIVTGECIRRKIRNYVDLVKSEDPEYRIYIKQDATLNTKDNKAFEQFGIKNAATDGKLKEKIKEVKKTQNVDQLVFDFMCEHFYDIRSFGAVVTTASKANLNCGQIKGPVQIDMAESVDPVVPRELTITRMAITTDKDAENKKNEMGNKHIIPYGLYWVEGHISANQAAKTGFSEKDLGIFWEAMMNMFEEDRSSMRGKMAMRKLIVFKHGSKYGDERAHKLFEAVSAKRRDDVEVARDYKDYVITIEDNSIPSSVQTIIMD